MPAYYNEFDPQAAAWLRELIKTGLIPDGEVDERSITEVEPSDVEGFVQCHWFAGIGGWPLALRLAGWADDRAVWTGSCPCPPFSAAGKKKQCPECGGKPIPHPLKTGIFACVPCGHEWLADERHLWPEMLRLMRGAKPAIAFGEQVSGPDGLVWLAGVRATLEALGYDVGAIDTCAASAGEKAEVEVIDEFSGEVVYRGIGRLGAPHIRQRIYWVANAELQRAGSRDQQIAPPEQRRNRPAKRGEAVGLAKPNGNRCDQARGRQPATGNDGAVGNGGAVGLGNAERPERGTHQQHDELSSGRQQTTGGPRGAGLDSDSAGPDGLGESFQSRLEGLTRNGHDGDQPGRVGAIEDGSATASSGDGFWSDFRIIPFRDGKTRRIESRTEPLAHGVSGRVAMLRGYGNAIVPALAAEFIQACQEAMTGAQPC